MDSNRHRGRTGPGTHWWAAVDSNRHHASAGRCGKFGAHSQTRECQQRQVRTRSDIVVGRGGIEPPTSALIGLSAVGSRVGGPRKWRGVIRPGSSVLAGRFKHGPVEARSEVDDAGRADPVIVVALT